MNIQSINQNYQSSASTKNVNFGMKVHLSKRIMDALDPLERFDQFQQLNRLWAKIKPFGEMPDGKGPILDILSDDEYLRKRVESPLPTQRIHGSYKPYPWGVEAGTRIEMGEEFLKNPIVSILRLLSESSRSSAVDSVRRYKNCEIVCNKVPFEGGLDIEYYTINIKEQTA